jgi:putative membrane protein
MRYLLWILKLALFTLVLAFALKNTEPVTVRYFPGGELQSPLILVLLAVFCAGVAIGLAAALAQVFRQRREITQLKGKLRQAEQAGAVSAGNTGGLIRS